METSKTCNVVCRSEMPAQGGVTLHFEPAPGTKTTEFFQVIPAAGLLVLYATKQATADFFQPGGKYLVTFTKQE